MAIEQELANAAFFRDNYTLDAGGVPADAGSMAYRASMLKVNLQTQARMEAGAKASQVRDSFMTGQIDSEQRDALLQEIEIEQEAKIQNAAVAEEAFKAGDPAAIQLAGQLWFENQVVPTIESSYAGGETPAQPIVGPSAPPPTVAPTTPVTTPVTSPSAAMATPPVTAGTPLSTATTNFLSNIPQLAQAPTVSPLISNLPELRGGGGGTSAIDPTLRPYLETGLQAAEQLYLRQTPQLYPGQMYVSPSQQTLDALTQQEQIARTQPSALQAAQESYMQGLGGLSATAGGAFLMGNPYLQSAIAASTRPIERQFAETTLPGIASGFSRAGRYGSEAMARSVGQATEATGRALGDVAADIAYTGYEAERGRQQQAIGGQISAAQVAPQIYGQQFLPSQQLAQVGAAQETLAGQPLQEAMQRFQYSQQIPYQQLSGFLSSVYGTPMGSSQYQPAPQTNQFGQVLGGVATGAGVGRLFQEAGVKDVFGFNPSTFGALAGGAAGLLF